MCGGCGEVEVVESGEEMSHMDAVSHATRSAIVHNRADPWRTPQKEFCEGCAKWCGGGNLDVIQ